MDEIVVCKSQYLRILIFALLIMKYYKQVVNSVKIVLSCYLNRSVCSEVNNGSPGTVIYSSISQFTWL